MRRVARSVELVLAVFGCLVAGGLLGLWASLAVKEKQR
jgi:hypothetical protein